MPEHSRKRRTGWLIVMILSLLLLIAVLVAGILYLIPWLAGGHEVPFSSTVESEISEVSEPVILPDNPIDFATLQAKNPEIIGWIRMPGTVIDYPVMQSGPKTEENFYLSHDPDRKKYRPGSIYIQRCNATEFTDPNTVIYGHNMKSGAMFAALYKMRNATFFKEHEYLTIYTPGHILTYRVYAAFVYDDRHIINSFNFRDRSQFGIFLEETLNPSSIKRNVREGVEVTTNDRIITMSTCTTNPNKRYLVTAVLIGDELTK